MIFLALVIAFGVVVWMLLPPWIVYQYFCGEYVDYAGPWIVGNLLFVGVFAIAYKLLSG